MVIPEFPECSSVGHVAPAVPAAKRFVMTILKSSLIAIALMFAVTASAQQPGRIRGQIEKVDGPNLVLKQRDGSMLNVKVADDARISALTKAAVADLKDDTFIGIAGMPRPDGSIEAFSVHIFLPAQRGVVPDRHGPWDGRPNSTMTNAYIEGTPAAAAGGQGFKVKYKDGEKNIVVTSQTSIVAVAPGSRDDIKAGASVIIFASDKQADGSVLAKTMYVGRGVTPAL